MVYEVYTRCESYIRCKVFCFFFFFFVDSWERPQSKYQYNRNEKVLISRLKNSIVLKIYLKCIKINNIIELFRIYLNLLTVLKR